MVHLNQTIRLIASIFAALSKYTMPIFIEWEIMMPFFTKIPIICDFLKKGNMEIEFLRK